MSSRRSRRARGLLATGLAVLAAAGGAAGYVLTKSSGSQAESTQYTFATARRGELRETVDAPFTMTQGTQTQLRAPAAGVVTKLDLSEGQALPTLAPLLEVNGSAIYGIASATPFYRDLAAGDTGDDVKALQSALSAAVGGSADNPTVQLMNDGRPVNVPVVVGLATSTGVQIIAGLQPGQSVITGVVSSGGATTTTTGQGGGFPGGGLFGGGGVIGGGRGGAGGGGGAAGGGQGQQGQR